MDTKKRPCAKCGVELLVNDENFYKRKETKEGFRRDCKSCVKEARSRYRESNKEKVSKSHSEWRKRNGEYIQNKGRLYYQENKETILKKVKNHYRENAEEINKRKKIYLENNKEKAAASKRNWARNNKDKLYESSLKRRSKKHFVQFGRVVRRELLERDNWTCKQCGVKVHDRNEGGVKKSYLWNDEFKAHLDHIIPISKGGDSTPDNIQTLCRTCNLSKSSKTELEIGETGQIKMSL